MSDSSSDSSVGVSTQSVTLKKDKVCLVCGDKALGYNFNAVSCESCKAFFRRNAHKTIKGRCQGQCAVTVESRSFCKHCRQQKCFAVGMRKDMILNAEQKKVRKLKIIRNRLRRNGLPDDEIPEEEEVELTTSAVNSSTETAVTPPSGQTRAHRVSVDVCEEATPLGKPNHPLQKLSEEAIAKLDASKRALMSELEKAHELALQVPVKTAVKEIPTSATQFFNLAEGSILRIVKLAKGLSAFKRLTKDDQIALLKGGVTEMMMLRSALYFDYKTKNWDVNTVGVSANGSGPVTHSSGSEESNDASAVRMRFLDGCKLNKFGDDTKKMFAEYIKFVRSLLIVSHGDLSIIKLLTAMVLFSGDRVELDQQDNVHQMQESYADLLKSYIQLRFPDESGLFPRIVMTLTEMRTISEIHSKMLSKMNVVEIEPLLVEVFDLGHDQR